MKKIALLLMMVLAQTIYADGVSEALQSKLNFPTTDKRALDIINSKLSSIAFYTGTIDDFINKYQIKL